MKKNKSRILSFILALMLIASAFALSSCDDATAPSGTDTGTPTSSDTPGGTDSPTASDPTPTPEPPAPGTYLGGDAVPPPPNNPDNDNCSTELMVEPEEPLPASINVTLVIEAGDQTVQYEDVVPNTRFREVVQVSWDASSADDFTVAKMLIEANGDHGLNFNLPDPPTPANFSYLSSVTYGSPPNDHTWASGQWGYDGWVFRVDDKFPVTPLDGYEDTYYEGTAINQTYLKDGDIVHFFYDFPATFSAELDHIEADYVRADSEKVDYDSGSHTLTVPLQFHYSYIAPGDDPKHSDDEMQVWNYNDLEDFDEYPIIGRLLDLGGIAVPGVTMTFDIVSGSAIFIGANITPGETYIVETDNVLRPIDDEEWHDFINDAYFYLTGAYSKITVPIQ